MKRFKARKIKKKKSKLKLTIFTFFFFFSYVFAIKYLSGNRLSKSVLENDINYINFDVIKIVSHKIEESINKPVTLLNRNIKVTNSNDKKTTLTTSKKDLINTSNQTFNEVSLYEPTIYIYNTHQSEKYIDYGVYDAASHLSDDLTKKGFITYFEDQSVTAFLQSNNLKYYKSYTVSRKYLDEAKAKYKSLNYFFDIHRDALSKEKSTFIKDNVSYAKIMFVVGAENSSYDVNLNNANKLNNIIEKILPGISRGVIKKQGSGVNGIYNQDVSENVFLIEVGGDKNTKDEVLRTINILSQAINEYIKGVI